MTETLDVVAIGSALLDKQYSVSNLPAPDGGAFAHDESVAFGGVAANVAVALSRLGRSTGVVVRLGDDDVADAVADNLREEGITLDHVRRGNQPSTYCMVFSDSDGERTIVTRSGAAKNLRLTDHDETILRSATFVFANGYCPDCVTSRLGELAANGAIRLAFDLASPLDGLKDRGTERETVDALLPHLELFVANETSVRSYLGASGLDAVDVLRAHGVSRGALTRGERGAVLWANGSVVELSAMDVDVIDTTGAGDAFVSGLLHRWLLADAPIRSAGRFATAAAGYNCTQQGARSGMVGEDRLKAVVRNWPA